MGNSVKITYKKAAPGYDVLANGEKIGFVQKSHPSVQLAWEATGMDGTTCRGYARHDAASGMYWTMKSKQEEAAVKRGEVHFCETAAAKELVYINVSSEKSDLKDTPFMDGDQWFRAKYGKYENEIRMEMSKLVPDGFDGDLTSFYHLHCGSVSSIEEGDSYQDNDADCWNDYRRAWNEVNKAQEAAPVCENPFCDKNPCVCDIPTDCPFCESNPCKCSETKGEYCKPCGATGMIQHTECPYCKGSGIVDVAAPVEGNGITKLVLITPKCYRVQIAKKYLGYVTYDELKKSWMAGSPGKERVYYGETAQEAADEMYRAMQQPKLRQDPRAELAAHKVHLETSHKFFGPEQISRKQAIESMIAARAFDAKMKEDIGELEWVEVDETPAPAPSIPMDFTHFYINRYTNKKGLIQDNDRFKYYTVDLEAGTFDEIDYKWFNYHIPAFDKIGHNGSLGKRIYEIVYKPLEHDGQDDLTPMTQEELDKMGPLGEDEDLLSLEELEAIEKEEQEKAAAPVVAIQEEPEEKFTWDDVIPTEPEEPGLTPVEERVIKINVSPLGCTVCKSRKDVKKLMLGDEWAVTSVTLCRKDRIKLLQVLQEDLRKPEPRSWENEVQDAVGHGITGDQILDLAKGGKR